MNYLILGQRVGGMPERLSDFLKSNMKNLQVLFTCEVTAPSDSAVQTSSNEIMQYTCFNNQLSGFLISSSTCFIGLFEGEETRVLGQIEDLLASGVVSNVRVVREQNVANTVCKGWYVSKKPVLGLSLRQLLLPENLAEFVDSALKPFPNRPRH